MEKQKSSLIQFKTIAKQAFDLYKGNFMPLTSIAIIYVLLAAFTAIAPQLFGLSSGASDELLYEPSMLAQVGIFVFVFTVLAEIIDNVGYSANLRSCSQAAAKKDASVGTSISFALANVKEIIMLIIHILVYTYLWIPVVLIFGFVLASTNPAALAAITPFMGIAPFLILIFILFLIPRMLSVVFAFPIMMAKDSPNSKEALAQSIKVSKGMLGTIFINNLLLGVLIGVVIGAISFLSVQIFGGTNLPTDATEVQSFGTITDFIMLLPAIIAAAYTAAFNYIFARNAIKEKGI